MKIWACKIGECDESDLKMVGADFPMREAIRDAYIRITGKEPRFLFSGWGAQLDDIEREVVERQTPSP